MYLRSFADGNGDGTGDLAGLRNRIPYLVDLGVDAVWINPWYRSPMRDGGYDVADYRAIDERFGTLADAEAFIDEAQAAGLRVIVDLVPNHTSDEHEWFVEALASAPGSAARERYHFRPGAAPPAANRPPTGRRCFGGPAWTRIRRRRVVPAPVRPVASPTSTGRTPRSRPSSRRSCGSGSTGASTGSGSTSRTGW